MSTCVKAWGFSYEFSKIFKKKYLEDYLKAAASVKIVKILKLDHTMGKPHYSYDKSLPSSELSRMA